MTQAEDILRGRRTEIDFINGAVVRPGEDYGIAKPYTRIMVRRLKAKQGPG